MVQNYINIITKHYFDFEGRTRRADFWYFVLVNLIVGIVLGIVQNILHLGQMITSLYSLALLLPNLGLGARRLHDTGRSGWWLLIAFIPVLGWILLIYWYCVSGTPGSNQYGADPKGGVGATAAA